jgi:ABC-type sugar transport system ATPase subunit
LDRLIWERISPIVELLYEYMSKEEYILKMMGISKEFPGVQALKNVDFDLRKGEVHALVGENGAGKSTLIKILAGVYKADEGQVWLKGEKVGFSEYSGDD